jgi:hypothetical protein
MAKITASNNCPGATLLFNNNQTINSKRLKHNCVWGRFSRMVSR